MIIIIVVHRRQQTANRRGLLAGRLANGKTRQGNGNSKAMQAVAEYRGDMPCLPAGATTRLTFVRSVLRSGPAGTNETPDLPSRNAARLVSLRARACSRIRDRSSIGIGRDKTNSKTQRCNEKNVRRIIVRSTWIVYDRPRAYEEWRAGAANDRNGHVAPYTYETRGSCSLLRWCSLVAAENGTR
ncbi:Uncharacterized protein DBV15_11362 [Temnothorax longispinosus]|uniref:Uncharacterized protein n=1 Tax=Temnothorax longispinosus TaxID=300112 RepID=A0A4S2KNG1_9HYME|nr:Uncharacterized protein DBV15_11362 [Temnothorax longispinosus]